MIKTPRDPCPQPVETVVGQEAPIQTTPPAPPLLPPLQLPTSSWTLRGLVIQPNMTVLELYSEKGLRRLSQPTSAQRNKDIRAKNLVCRWHCHWWQPQALWPPGITLSPSHPPSSPGIRMRSEQSWFLAYEYRNDTNFAVFSIHMVAVHLLLTYPLNKPLERHCSKLQWYSSGQNRLNSLSLLNFHLTVRKLPRLLSGGMGIRAQAGRRWSPSLGTELLPPGHQHQFTQGAGWAPGCGASAGAEGEDEGPGTRRGTRLPTLQGEYFQERRWRKESKVKHNGKETPGLWWVTGNERGASGFSSDHLRFLETVSRSRRSSRTKQFCWIFCKLKLSWVCQDQPRGVDRSRHDERTQILNSARLSSPGTFITVSCVS